MDNFSQLQPHILKFMFAAFKVLCNSQISRTFLRLLFQGLCRLSPCSANNASPTQDGWWIDRQKEERSQQGGYWSRLGQVFMQNETFLFARVLSVVLHSKGKSILSEIVANLFYSV